ncbi:hypothetical protein HUW51_20320 [Adhaeribacter swui]|uniref:Uncharacterized protein n=1 Tax=Adhaeribacter swui TaxID=2086471 RepID=A0A7G7GCR7_9BACT|nr:AsmA-like C-terminal region-containing protein [Adhaeribacter swui]QNF34951.1 hypothetical protein HUW51_20320 [Adhaeribacter swui]
MRLNVKTKKYVLIFVLLLSILSIAFEVIARIYRQKASSYIRTRFELQSDLVLEPFSTSFSIWKHFPRATFTFNNLSLVDTVGTARLQVAAVKKAEIIIPLTQFNLHRIRVARLVLNDFVFRQFINENGNKNGLRFRQVVRPDTTAEKFLFRIKNVVINNGQFISENRFKKNSIAIKINQTKLAVERTADELNISGNLQGAITHYVTNRRKLFQNEAIALNAHYRYDLTKKQGQIYQTQAIVNNSTLHVKGTHTSLSTGVGANLDITIAGYQPILQIFRQIMPPTAVHSLNKLRSNSRVYLIGRFQGESGPRFRPRSIVKFRLNNGELFLPSINKKINNVMLAGILDNGTKHLPESSRLLLSRISAQMGKGQVQMHIDLKNFTKPEFTLAGKGQLNLPELTQLLSLPISKVNQGEITGNLKISGVLPDSLQGSSPQVSAHGEIELKQAAFQPEGFLVMCRNVTGKILFTDKDVSLKNLGGLLAGKPFNLNASIQNYLPYLFKQPGLLRAKVDFTAAALHADWIQGNLYASNGGRLAADLNQAQAYNQSSSIYRLASYRPTGESAYRLVKNSRQMQKGSNTTQTRTEPEVNQVLLSLLRAASSQINVRVGVLNVTSKEALRNLKFQVNQLGQRVTLTNMRFTSSEGGNATATGGFQLTRAGIRSPYLQANLHYDFLNLQTFMLHLAELKKLVPQSEGNTRQNSKRRKANLQKNSFFAALKVTAHRVQYEYLHGSNLLLRVNLNKERAQLSQLSLNAFGGQINSHGNLQINNAHNIYPLRLQAQVKGINLQQLFAVANQMNMDVLSSNSIRGEAECQVSLTTALDQTFSPAFERTAAYANATFRGMELIEVAPIQNALRFLRNERTRHLFFDDVTTRFVMQNNQFITPKVRMNSNLTDFELSGKYKMGGSADLNMDINVFNVLFGNNKKRIEKIQDSTATLSSSNLQHLILTREQDKYKVKLGNKKDRITNNKALLSEFNNVLRQHQLDTSFTFNQPLTAK